jgi:hypothetical protein
MKENIATDQRYCAPATGGGGKKKLINGNGEQNKKFLLCSSRQRIKEQITVYKL